MSAFLGHIRGASCGFWSMACLASLDGPFEALDARGARPSIPPEQLLQAALIQSLDTVCSERQLVEPIDFHLPFRWFVGVGIDEGVWDQGSDNHRNENLR
jgi:transposase